MPVEFGEKSLFCARFRGAWPRGGVTIYLRPSAFPPKGPTIGAGRWRYVRDRADGAPRDPTQGGPGLNHRDTPAVVSGDAMHPIAPGDPPDPPSTTSLPNPRRPRPGPERSRLVSFHLRPRSP